MANKLFDEFLKALETKDADEIAVLLKNKELLKKLDYSENIKQALDYAFTRGNTAFFKMVFDLQSAEILRKNVRYMRHCLLYPAASQGYTGIIKILLNIPIILNNELENVVRGEFPTMNVAAEYGQIGVIEIFLEIPEIVDALKRPLVYGEPFIKAAEKGHLNVIDQLLSHPKLTVYQENHQRIDAAFKRALLAHEFEVVKRLMRLQAIRESYTIQDRCALQIPAMYEEWDIVDSLLQMEGVLVPTEATKIRAQRGREECGVLFSEHTVGSHHDALQTTMAVKQYEVAYRMIQYYKRAGIPLPSKIQRPDFISGFSFVVPLSHFSEFPEVSTYENFDDFSVKFEKQLQDIRNSLIEVFKPNTVHEVTNCILNYCGFNWPLPPLPPISATAIAAPTEATLIVDRAVSTRNSTGQSTERINELQQRGLEPNMAAIPAASASASPTLLAAFDSSRAVTLHNISSGTTAADAAGIYNSQKPNKRKWNL